LSSRETRRPIAVRRGRSEIVAALAASRMFVATIHFNGQSIVAIDCDRAVGESYCLAHRLLEANGKRTLQLLSVRYLDRFVREGARLFAERKLVIDLSDTRPSVA
jgi:hypothetical protein